MATAVESPPFADFSPRYSLGRPETFQLEPEALATVAISPEGFVVHFADDELHARAHDAAELAAFLRAARNEGMWGA